jgi:hypothetical protein
MPSSEKERAERLFRQQQDAPKAIAEYRAKQANREAARRAFGTRSDTWEDQSVKKAAKKLNPRRAWIKIKNPKAPAATRAIDGTF